MPADILPINGLQPGVAMGYPRRGSQACDEGDDVDVSERLHEAEKDILRLMATQTKHEEVCALRYEAIKGGTDRIAGYIKWLAITVGALAFVVLGVATIGDLTRAMAGRVGVTITAAPNPPNPPNAPNPPNPR